MISLNVHDPQQSPTNLPQWVRCDAQLFPTSLHLQWPTPLGRAQAQIDLVHFVGAFLFRGVITQAGLTLPSHISTEVRSVPSPGHPSAQDDIGTAAALQYPFLAENRELFDLCAFLHHCLTPSDCLIPVYPFLIVYADGMERLGCESALERTRWVGAIWSVNASSSSPVPLSSLTMNLEFSGTFSTRAKQNLEGDLGRRRCESLDCPFRPPPRLEAGRHRIHPSPTEDLRPMLALSPRSTDLVLYDPFLSLSCPASSPHPPKRPSTSLDGPPMTAMWPTRKADSSSPE